MIFFDQRMSTTAHNYSTDIRGTGSHMSYELRLDDADSLLDRFDITSDESSCSLHCLSFMPKEYFYDSFELETIFKTVQLYGEQDLENPEWLTKGWGSVLVSEVHSKSAQLPIHLPFHARYYVPSLGGASMWTMIPSPELFVACRQSDVAFEDNPWDTPSILSSIMGNEYSFHMLQNLDSSPSMLGGSRVDLRASSAVLTLTILSVMIGFFYAAAKLRHY